MSTSTTADDNRHDFTFFPPLSLFTLPPLTNSNAHLQPPSNSFLPPPNHIEPSCPSRYLVSSPSRPSLPSTRSWLFLRDRPPANLRMVRVVLNFHPSCFISVSLLFLGQRAHSRPRPHFPLLPLVSPLTCLCNANLTLRVLLAASQLLPSQT